MSAILLLVSVITLLYVLTIFTKRNTATPQKATDSNMATYGLFTYHSGEIFISCSVKKPVLLFINHLTVLSKLFHKDTYEYVSLTLQDESRRWINELGNSGRMDIFESISKVLFSFAIRAFAGSELADGPHFNRFVELYKSGSAEHQIGKDFLHVLPVVLPTFKGKQKRIHDEQKEILREVVENRLQNGVQHGDLLDKIIKYFQEKGELDMDVLYIVVWLCISGTTATSLGIISWIVIELLRHPEEKQKLIEELAKLPKSENNSFSQDELNSLQYLERCARESLRLHSSGVATRAVLSKFAIAKGDGSSSSYIIPPGSLAFFPHYFFNMDMYSNPTKFQPDRFLSEGLKPYTFLGFGAGRHPCAGSKFGLQNIKIIVTALFTNYDMELASTVETVRRQLFGVSALANPVYVNYKKL